MKTVTLQAAVDALTMDNVMSVYGGVKGRCYCGCAGDHHYNSKFLKEAGKDRGYAIKADEVNNKEVKLIIGVINAAERVEVQEVCITTYVGKMAYTAYFTIAERERRAVAKGAL